MVEIAANSTVEEKNAEFKFHFMIHADKKSAGKWQDLPIPFPADEKEIESFHGDKSGVSQLPSYLRGALVRT
jgi:hypothetical protein